MKVHTIYIDIAVTCGGTCLHCFDVVERVALGRETSNPTLVIFIFFFTSKRWAFGDFQYAFFSCPTGLEYLINYLNA